MIAWVDIEATGFDERAGNAHVLEVALVVTDDDLVEKANFSTVVQPVGTPIEAVAMDPVVTKMHEENGLLAELRAGKGMRRYEAEEAAIRFIGETLAGSVELDVCVNCKKTYAEHYEVSGIVSCPAIDPTLTQKMTRFQAKQVSIVSQTPLAGSTVAFDRRWLRHHMPKLEGLFSYRSIDVSSLTELSRRWAPKVYEGRPKAGKAHRALADVRESIAYLRYFRESGFVGGGNWV